MRLKSWFALMLASILAIALEAAPEPSFFLGEYLRTSGDALNCYFTVETRRLERTRSIELGRRLGINMPAKSFDEFVQLFKQHFPHCDVLRSQTETNVFHIIDGSLLKTSDYALTQAVTISYSGTLGSGGSDGLAANLNRQVPALNYKTSGDWRYMFDDHVTKVIINATNAPARDVLTRAVPIPEYSRILWIAETWSNGNSTVQFFGPRNMQIRH